MLRRFTSLPIALLSSALLAACVPAPEDVAPLSADQPLVQRSEHAWVEATIALEGREIVRGTNDFSITLRGLQGAEMPLLESLEAAMAAHSHRVSAATLVRNGQQYRADLDLFMSGRWQIGLGIALGAEADRIEFSLDVP